MKRFYLALLIGILWASVSDAQRLKRGRLVYRDIGVNVTGILNQLDIIPLKTAPVGEVALLFRKQRENKRGTYRFGIGGRIGGEELTITSFNVKIGREYLKSIDGSGWHYYYGFDVLAFVDRFEDGGLGVGPIFGIRYNFNEYISLSTEGSAYLTGSGGAVNGFAVSIRPPTGLYFSFKLYKNRSDIEEILD